MTTSTLGLEFARSFWYIVGLQIAKYLKEKWHVGFVYMFSWESYRLTCPASCKLWWKQRLREIHWRWGFQNGLGSRMQHNYPWSHQGPNASSKHWWKWRWQRPEMPDLRRSMPSNKRKVFRWTSCATTWSGSWHFRLILRKGWINKRKQNKGHVVLPIANKIGAM